MRIVFTQRQYINASMIWNNRFVAKAIDFSCDIYDSRFEVGDHRIIDGRMRERRIDFFLKDLLSLLEDRDVGLQHEALRLAKKLFDQLLAWLQALGCCWDATMWSQKANMSVKGYWITTKNSGVMSSGPDFVDQFRLAAGYVDRILKGEKPADLPVQNPTKFELAINLKTAKSLDLSVSPSLLARANQIIE
jgi:ABC transporter substrate binding protein